MVESLSPDVKSQLRLERGTASFAGHADDGSGWVPQPASSCGASHCIRTTLVLVQSGCCKKQAVGQDNWTIYFRRCTLSIPYFCSEDAYACSNQHSLDHLLIRFMHFDMLEMVQGGCLSERAAVGTVNLPAGEGTLPLRLLDGFDFYVEERQVVQPDEAEQEAAEDLTERPAGLEVLEQGGDDLLCPPPPPFTHTHTHTHIHRHMGTLDLVPAHCCNSSRVPLDAVARRELDESFCKKRF